MRLHWITALLVIALVCVGLDMTGLDDPDPSRPQLFRMHQSVGALVLIPSLARIAWLFVSPLPPPAAMEPKEVMIAKVVKGLLYLLLLAIPVSGWVMSNAGGYPVSLFDLPQIVGKDQGPHELAEGLHEWAAYRMIALVLLHVLGSLEHRFIDPKPEADVLRRMS